MLAGSCQKKEKNKNWKFMIGVFHLQKHMFEEQFQGMPEEKITKSKLSVFFLVGPDSSISEDSSTIEYSARALILILIKDLRHSI